MKKMNKADVAAKASKKATRGNYANSSKKLEEQIEALVNQRLQNKLARLSGTGTPCQEIQARDLSYFNSKPGKASLWLACEKATKGFHESIGSLTHKANLRHSKSIASITFDWFIDELVKENLEEVGFVWSYGEVFCLIKGVRSQVLRQAEACKDPVIKNANYALADFLDDKKTVKRIAKALNRG